MRLTARLSRSSVAASVLIEAGTNDFMEFLNHRDEFERRVVKRLFGLKLTGRLGQSAALSLRGKDDHR
jgi:hypothetical protein